MSQQTVEAVVGKALLDPAFRAAFYADPDQTLGSYDLSRRELRALKLIDWETLDVLSEHLRTMTALR